MGLEESIRKLTTYIPGQRWGVWADEQRQVQMCRFDSHLGPDVWATPIGHATEKELLRRGWVKVQGHESTNASFRTALEQIEAGRPAGSPESTLATDGSWREFARDLQRIARVALRGA
jgi:hypothetical protein